MLCHRWSTLPDHRMCPGLFPADLPTGRSSGELAEIISHLPTRHLVPVSRHRPKYNHAAALKGPPSWEWEHAVHPPLSMSFHSMCGGIYRLEDKELYTILPLPSDHLSHKGTHGTLWPPKLGNKGGDYPGKTKRWKKFLCCFHY